MTGSLAQLISLASYGNEFLQSGYILPDYFPDSTVFQFCNTIKFCDRKKFFLLEKPQVVIIAENPNKWYEYLKRTGCEKIRLYYQSTKGEQGTDDFKSAGFVGGGGLWLIETIHAKYSDFWTNQWEVTKKEDANRRIWSVTYAIAHKKQATTDVQIDLQQTHSLLDSTLKEIANFAFERNFSGWGDTFDKARHVLKSETPTTTFYKEGFLLERNYSLIARQILYAAMSAWVFGGMGSWNDLYFENKNENRLYDSLSEKLYSTINQGVLSVVNSY
jgi:hypothetical protein